MYGTIQQKTYLAIVSDSVEELQEVLTRKEDTSSIGYIMGLSCMLGSENIVKYLVRKGYNINSPGVTGDDLPLLIATKSTSPEFVNFLLDLGADPFLENSKGISAFKLCMNRNSAQLSEVADILFKNPNVVWKLRKDALKLWSRVKLSLL